MKRKKFFPIFFLFLSIFISEFFFFTYYAYAEAVFTIQIQQPANNSEVTNPVRVKGTWSVTNDPPGLVTAYNVQIQWGDNTANNSVNINRTASGSGSDQLFNGTFDTEQISGCTSADGAEDDCTLGNFDHNYLASGPFTITARLYHQQLTGHEAGDTTANVTISIAPPPTTTTTSTTTTTTTTSTTTTTTPTTTSTSTTTTTTLPTCDITVSPNLNFNSMNPGDTSDNSTSISNGGNSPTTSLTIEGTNWSDSGSNIMYVGQTRWSLSSGQDYDSLMSNVTSSAIPLGSQVSPEIPLPVYFKLRIPAHQDVASYTQTIIFTAGC